MLVEDHFVKLRLLVLQATCMSEPGILDDQSLVGLPPKTDRSIPPTRGKETE
jgi:hypothetical protein